jgi:hypothetical protein
MARVNPQAATSEVLGCAVTKLKTKKGGAMPPSSEWPCLEDGIT